MHGKTSTRYLHVAAEPRDCRLIEPRAKGAMVEVACAAEVTVESGRPSLILTGLIRERYRVSFLTAAGKAHVTHGGNDLIWVGTLALKRLADPATVLDMLRIRYLECAVTRGADGYQATVERGKRSGARFDFQCADPRRLMGAPTGTRLFIRTQLGEALTAQFDLAALK